MPHSFECARVERFKRGSGLPILIPSIELIEIGAGGGSIAHCNRLGLLNIGPESSGSVPGPACYGRGGTEPTVTDADLLLGYLSQDNFLGGEMKLDVAAAEQAMSRLAGELKVGSTEAAWGICNVVNENMASAARIHIAENGLDPRDFTMVATGGAGPVHAVEVARKLRIPRVLVPIAAGAGSCLGMLAAPARIDRAWSEPAASGRCRLGECGGQSRCAARPRVRSSSAAAGAERGRMGDRRGDAVLRPGRRDRRSPFPMRRFPLSTAKVLLADFRGPSMSGSTGRLVPNAAPQVITWRLVGRAPTEGHHFEWGDDR